MSSFSYRVKQELAQRTGKAALLQAQAYGLFLFSREFSAERVVFQSENDFAVQIAADTLASRKITGSLRQTVSPRDRNTLLCRMELAGEDAKALLNSFGCEDTFPVNDDFLDTEKKLSFFLGGAFLACGSVSDPEKSFRLEFTARSEELCSILEELLEDIVPCRRSERRGNPILYCKEREKVADLLTFLGATHATLELTESIMVRDMRNEVNRKTNAEMANLRKTTEAGLRQSEDIRLLVDTLGWEGIPEELTALAKVRLENPEATLAELSGQLEPPLSRSGIAHRFAKIAAMAEEIRSGKA